MLDNIGEITWMTACRKASTKRLHVSVAGQALVEFTLAVALILIMFLGLVDLAQAIFEKQVITHLSREGSNLASRGTDLTAAAAAIVSGSAPLDLAHKGCVIMTSVYNNNGVFVIKGQTIRGGITSPSRIGNTVGSAAVLPVTAVPIPQPNQTLYVTEVFYTYEPITPLVKLIGVVLPSSLYDVAYF